MGKAYLWLVPKQLALDWYVYPRHANRTAFMFTAGFFLMYFQFIRYMEWNKVRLRNETAPQQGLRRVRELEARGSPSQGALPRHEARGRLQAKTPRISLIIVISYQRAARSSSVAEWPRSPRPSPPAATLQYAIAPPRQPLLRPDSSRIAAT